MLDIQLGRRNLSPIQRIAITEKYRPIYERQALINKQNAMSKARKSNENNKNEQFSQNSSTTVSTQNKIDVRAKLAETAGVSTDTYSKGKKILDSDNEEVKKAVLSGEMSINAGYNKIRENKKVEDNNVASTTITQSITTSPTLPKPQISEEVRQICEDLKTERSKEYLDSIWDYKIDIIECMNAGYNKVIKDLIETNIRQRGIGNPNPVKLGRCIKELERIYGVEHGNNQYNRTPKVSESSISSQEQLADMIGISVDTLQNYKKLTELVPELQDWVETGILAPTTAIAIMRSLKGNLIRYLTRTGTPQVNDKRPSVRAGGLGVSYNIRLNIIILLDLENPLRFCLYMI